MSFQLLESLHVRKLLCDQVYQFSSYLEVCNLCFILFYFFFLFTAASVAYGSSQVRGHIGAAAAGLYHSSRQRQILNPLSEARGQTLILGFIIG